MRILLYEIRKLLNWKTILLLLAVNFIVYFIRIEFDIKHFPNGRPELDSYQVSLEMVDKYGANVDAAAIADLRKIYEERVAEADRYLLAREDFAATGLAGYSALIESDPEGKDEAIESLRNQLMFVEEVDLLWELQARSYMLDQLERHANNVRPPSSLNEAQQSRWLDIRESGPYNVYQSSIYENYNNFIFHVSVAITLSVILVVLPVYMNDRARRVLELQYTSRAGRRLYKTKAVAGMLSVLIVITALLGLYFTLYASNGTFKFWDLPVQAMSYGYHWYNPTFLQYMLLTVGAVYVIGLAVARLTMGFSAVMPTYVSLIGVHVPIAAGLLLYGLKLFVPQMISWNYPQWLMPTLYSALLVIAIGFGMATWKREVKRDIGVG